MKGINNEIKVVEYINTSSFKNLTENQKQMFLKMNNGIEPKEISAKRLKDNSKSDIIIILDGIEFNISIKMGFGNSFHQEGVESFISYLRNIEDNEEVFHYIREFIWGDGTTDGKGNHDERIDGRTFINTYQTKCDIIQDYFNKHQNSLINRFIISGKKNTTMDYIWYGAENGVLMDINMFISKLTSKSNSNLSICGMRFQAWNRAITNPKSDKRRGQIQLKLSNIDKLINNGKSN